MGKITARMVPPVGRDTARQATKTDNHGAKSWHAARVLLSVVYSVESEGLGQRLIELSNLVMEFNGLSRLSSRLAMEYKVLRSLEAMNKNRMPSIPQHLLRCATDVSLLGSSD